MTIDWIAFTSQSAQSALLGGFLIGLASVLLVMFNGRIAGISGIVGSLMGSFNSSTRSAYERHWRIAFVAGLLASPWLYAQLTPLPSVQIEADTLTLIIAGLLVGLGTRYGAGCTSGHGVCGLSRLSGRSLFATVLFMAAGFATVYVVRHLLA
jgi:uncharacterized protein